MLEFFPSCFISFVYPLFLILLIIVVFLIVLVKFINEETDSLMFNYNWWLKVKEKITKLWKWIRKRGK